MACDYNQICDKLDKTRCKLKLSDTYEAIHSPACTGTSPGKQKCTEDNAAMSRLRGKDIEPFKQHKKVRNDDYRGAALVRLLFLCSDL